MAESDYIYEQGEPISEGSHGQHDYVFSNGEPVPDTGKSEVVFESGIGLGQAASAYFAAIGRSVVGKVSPDDFSIITEVSDSRSGDGDGIGGSPGVVWQYNGESDNDNSIIERDPNDMSIVSISSNPSSNVTEAGGKEDVIWTCDATEELLYELNPSDKSIIQSQAPPHNDTPNGMGGSSSVVYHGDGQENIWELDSSDLSTVRSGSFPNSPTNGVGGSEENMYGINVDGEYFYEMDPSDFSFIRSVDVGGHGGAGGS